MTTASEEAERLFPHLEPNEHNGVYTIDFLRSQSRDAFIAGAEWQAQQPVEITDEMVERGVEELTNEGWRPPTVPQTEPYEGYTKAVVRGVIEAALGGSDERDL